MFGDEKLPNYMGCLGYMGVSKNRGILPPKMDGENNGLNPMNKWMIWGVFPLFLETSI